MSSSQALLDTLQERLRTTPKPEPIDCPCGAVCGASVWAGYEDLTLTGWFRLLQPVEDDLARIGMTIEYVAHARGADRGMVISYLGELRLRHSQIDWSGDVTFLPSAITSSLDVAINVLRGRQLREGEIKCRQQLSE